MWKFLKYLGLELFLCVVLLGLYISSEFNNVGEAPIVEIESGHYVFALLKGHDGSSEIRERRLYQEALKQVYDPISAQKGVKYLPVEDYIEATSSYKEMPFDIPRKYYPLLVTFKNINDPNRVDQAAGFYAVAYDYNGSTVISYRGTV